MMEQRIIRYEVRVTKKVQKNLRKLPPEVVRRFVVLAEQLRDRGPVAHDWKNYGKLGEGRYHCHLAYSYSACWTHEKGTITIEVYYVGSRENAQY